VTNKEQYDKYITLAGPAIQKHSAPFHLRAQIESSLFRNKSSLFLSTEFPVRSLREFSNKSLNRVGYLP